MKGVYMPDKIELTAEELRDLKDDIKFRVSMTMELKGIKNSVEEFNKKFKAYNNMRGFVSAHTWAIGLLYGIIGIVFYFIIRL